MTYPKAHALGGLFFAFMIPLLGLLWRDAVAPLMLLGIPLLGMYRYFLGIGAILRRETPDMLAFLFVPCKGKIMPWAFPIAFFASLLFGVLMLLPARILLDYSVDLALHAFFVPTVYYAITTLLLFKTNKA